MSDEIKLRCDCEPGTHHAPRYDSEGRIKIFADKKPCPLKANVEEEDPYEAAGKAAAESLMPTDGELLAKLGRQATPTPVDPGKQLADIAWIEALTEDLAEQVHRLANDTDRKEREELEAMGMQSDEELCAQLKVR